MGHSAYCGRKETGVKCGLCASGRVRRGRRRAACSFLRHSGRLAMRRVWVVRATVVACVLIVLTVGAATAFAGGGGGNSATPGQPPNFHVVATGPVGFAAGDGTNGCAFGSFLI